MKHSLSIREKLKTEGLVTEDNREICEMLKTRRLERLYRVLQQRTRYISVLLEAVDDGHNQAAVLRSAEAFGIQDVSVVEGGAPFRPSIRVTQNAHKWLTIRKYGDIESAIHGLRSRGYRIMASHLSSKAVPVDQVDLSRPTVLLFGNEHSGVSREGLDLADGTFVIPMYGFAQSFNISVAAAVTLHEVIRRARREADGRYGLSDEERKQLFHEWVLASVPARIRRALDSEKKAGVYWS